MASTPSRQQDYITESRAAARKLWEGYLELREAQNEWNAQDYSNTLDDGANGNTGVSAADVGAVVFATADAVKTVMDVGNATNVTNVL